MWILNNYGDHSLEWVKEYVDNFVVYDKKDLNVGYNIYDYCDWIIKNYDNLPEMVLFGKGNMLDRHITKEEFDKIVHNKTFTPILTQNHKVGEMVSCFFYQNGEYKEIVVPSSYYKNGLFYEINNSWYFNFHEKRYFDTYNEFADLMGLSKPKYIGFAPGGCYIVPRENILKRSKEFYEKLKGFVDYSNDCAEAHVIERALYTIWL